MDAEEILDDLPASADESEFEDDAGFLADSELDDDPDVLDDDQTSGKKQASDNVQNFKFDTGDKHMTEEKAAFIIEYVNERFETLRAHPAQELLDFPPPLVRKIQQTLQDILDKPLHYPAANITILKLSSPLEWAAEIYSLMTERGLHLCARSSAPQDLADYQVEELSNDMTVYLSFVKNKFYTGSGTKVTGRDTGGKDRQRRRGLTRERSNGWHDSILDSATRGFHAQWVSVMEVPGTRNIKDRDLLLHYRIICKLAEQVFGCLLGSHQKGSQLDRLLWPTTWKRYSPWPAFREGIRGVALPMTEEQREAYNARRRVENMTEEQHEAINAKRRVENMTEAQVEARNAPRRLANLTGPVPWRNENMTDAQVEARKASRRVENKTEEQREAIRAKGRVENMTKEQHEAKKAKARRFRERKKLAARKALEEKTGSEMNKMDADMTGS